MYVFYVKPQYSHVDLAFQKIYNGIFIPLLTICGAFSTNILVGRTCVSCGRQLRLRSMTGAPQSATPREENHETRSAWSRRRDAPVQRRLRGEDWGVDGQVRRQLPDGLAQWHGGLREDIARRDGAD